MKKDWLKLERNPANSEVIFDLDAKISRLTELEKTQENSEFWNNPEAAKTLLREQKQISVLVENFLGLDNELDETAILLELALEEEDQSVIKEIEEKLDSIEEHMRGLEVQRLFLSRKTSAMRSWRSMPARVGPRPKTGLKCS